MCHSSMSNVGSDTFRRPKFDEAVMTGERPENVVTLDPTALAASSTSSAILFLLLFVPALGTVLFGAVDQITWALFYLLWTAVILLWIADVRTRGGFLLNRSVLIIPLLGLVAL